MSIVASIVIGFVCLQPSPVSAGLDSLRVVSIEPSPRTLHATTKADIVIHFNQPVDRSSVTPQSFWAFGRWSGPVEGDFEFRDGDSTVVLNPTDNFSAGEQVMVILSHDLRGSQGDLFRLSGYSFQFWTRARPSLMQFVQTAVLDTNANLVESSRPYGGIASDLNNDGWLDITTVNEDTADVRVFLNAADGVGSFGDFLQPTNRVNLQASPSEPSDFNRDGNVDLCVANIAVGTISILLGQGDGTFAPQQEITVGAQPRGIAVLDADGDGDIDIVNTNFSNNNLSILFNNGQGVFSSPTFFEGGANGERSIAAGDMNEDGIMDLVVGTYTSQEVLVLAGLGNGTFSLVSSQSAGGSMWMLMLGDVNDDGHEDVAGVNIFDFINDHGTILLGSGTGQLASATPYPTDPIPLATDLCDLDGDGDLDWITSSFNGDWFLFENDGLGNFTLNEEFLASANASCSLPFDMDNDGDLDLALIDEIADTIQILINSGQAVPGDVTGDGVTDVIDLLDLLAAWGDCFRCATYLNDDDVVDFFDLLLILANWSLLKNQTGDRPRHRPWRPDSSSPTKKK
ncbi:MAG: VCBS repeat-containing protein [Planctomycetota bacterium]|nr:VCBS repeat-containing protein [Planctomycetota bacterium]